MKKLALGNQVVTANAHQTLDMFSVGNALKRHENGDWGDVSPEDAQTNDLALETGDRIVSAYTDRAGTKFWIITEWDRSVTTVLLPSDY